MTLATGKGPVHGAISPSRLRPSARQWAGLLLLLLLLLLVTNGTAARAQGSGVAEAEAAAVAAVERAPAAAIIFMLRHAEKGTDDPRDPALNEAGGRRAAQLARLLKGAGVTHLFSSEYKRTMDTLAPLAQVLGVEVTVIPAREGDRQLEALRQLPPGSVAVVAGHSNTVPAMVRAMGGAAGDLTEDDYGDLFQIILPPAVQPSGEVITLRLSWGGGD